jgi:hypothetical protein
LKGLVRVSILGKTPEFHYLIIERNGTDERLTAGDVFKITYRDEFIIKQVSTDSLFERNITVDAEALGGANDIKVLLKAVELVDKAMSASVREALRGKPLPDSAIKIRYGEQAIGTVPVRIELTAQDWLRFAKMPANAKWQAQALEKALSINPDDTALRKTLAEQYLESGKLDQAAPSTGRFFPGSPMTWRPWPGFPASMSRRRITTRPCRSRSASPSSIRRMRGPTPSPGSCTARWASGMKPSHTIRRR